MKAWTEHGGRIDSARAAYRDAPAPWVDLSTGINPRPWSGIDLANVDLAALPSPSDLGDLERAAAAMFDCRTGEIAALPGTEVGLRVVGDLDLPRPYRHLTPSYRTHAEMLPGSGPITIDMLDAEAARGGTIILANPNNPDGRVIAPATLLAIAHALRERGGWLIVDEAFADAVPEASLLPMLTPDDPVIIFRSFGKFFGLAGLRLGFVAGPRVQLAAIRRRLGSWPVSAPALAVGTAAYRDRDWIAATRTALTLEAFHLDRMLARHGLTASGDCPLFRLVETDDAAAVFDRLARAGILTRPFDHAPRWLRFGLPADATVLERLDRALGDG
ncbi:MAG: pyridoxal phosphate-dependent class II aminotransferase [Candidatus Sphingomonas phytovorans]|nr:threonine-phosphate decarboxylase [Sphingomonas sp.]WEJ99705.1 MAG: pyridoxal phosphate-dependent class II aminotransferase [Sphingomonas sp.]